MKNEEVIALFHNVLMNKGWIGFTYDNDLQIFYDEAHETEFQIRDYSNGDFHCLLMRFCDDNTHTYLELYPNQFESIFDLIYYALEDGIEELENKTLREMERRIS